MNSIEKQFTRIGARATVRPHTRPGGGVEVNVLRDSRGEFFLIRHREEVDIEVAEATPWNRHLVLTARDTRAVEDGGDVAPEATFLCGHDERHWFVAAVPESARARTVQEARDALKPAEVWQAIAEHDLGVGQRDGRRNAAFLRQGEWFFLPRPWLEVDAKDVLEREPIRRGAGKPHVCQYLHRVGGERVYVHADHPNGLSVEAFRALPKPQRRGGGWRKMVRDARQVYVKGAIEHPDHETLWLAYWHQVVMNTESRARAMRHVAFLD